MGDQLNSFPKTGWVARPIEDISQALYKTEDNYWCLGFWAGNTVTEEGELTPDPSTYLVAVKYEDGEYKFDFAEKVEGYTALVKEDPIVFSVSPHNTASLTEAWGNEGNDAFYQRDKITIKSGSTDIDSALSVSGDLGVRGDISTLSGLQIGSPNYKLVFLNNVNLVTEHVPYAGVYWKVYGEEDGKKYLLNNFPVLGQQAFGATVSWRVDNTNNERYGYWYGNFPLIFFSSPEHQEKSVGMARSQEHPEHVWLTFLDSDGYLMPAPEDLKVRVNNFTGWAWEVKGI